MKAPAMQADQEDREPRAAGNVGELLELVNDSDLTTWEAKFIGDLRERYEKYQERTHISDKQMDSLRKIAAK